MVVPVDEGWDFGRSLVRMFCFLSGWKAGVWCPVLSAVILKGEG